jgi:hypothetical protein
MNLWLILFLVCGMRALPAAGIIEKLSLPLIADLQRADLYVLKLTPHPTAILILIPGFNGSGEDWIKNPIWQDFARDHNLDLAGVSFASDGKLLQQGRGYYYPAQGSGQLLLDGLCHAFGANTPLLLYGFSGGAHFTSGFEEWDPNAVMAWCAYSAEWWPSVASRSSSPPGLVVCGNEDERYGASLIYFKQGRALGKPWLWLSAPKTGHSIYLPAENFIRHYFSAILKNRGVKASGEWVDIDEKSKAEHDVLRDQPSVTGWLPDSKLFSRWQEVHQP